MASTNDLGKIPMAHHKKKKNMKKSYSLAEEILNLVEKGSQKFEKNAAELLKIIPAKALKEEDKTDDFLFLRFKGKDGEYQVNLWDESISDEHSILDIKSFASTGFTK